MEAERMLILEMLRDGRVTAEQADRLLAALEQTVEAEARPAAERERRGAPRPQAPVMDWGRFGRRLAERVQRRLAETFGNVSVGWSEDRAAAATTTRTRRTRRPETRAGETTEGVITAHAPEEGWTEIVVKCHAGHLEFTGTDGGMFRLVACRLVRPDETVSSEWQRDLPVSWTQEGPRRIYTIGRLNNPEITHDLTLRFEIPMEAEVMATTERGDISARSLSGALHVTTGGGSISCCEIEDDVAASSGGGDLTFTDIEGSLAARTGGGDVRVAEIEGDVEVQTGGGDLSITDIKGSLAARTGGGDVCVAEVEGDVEVQTGGGDLSINDVEGDVTAATGGGDVALADIEGSVTAKTGGGDIRLEDVEGDATVETAAGDIALSGVEGKISVRTGGGDVTG